MSVTNRAAPMTDTELDQLLVNTIRTLSIDAVGRAKSGHPGTPMALAPLVYTIWNRVMRFDPKDPIWPASCTAIRWRARSTPRAGRASIPTKFFWTPMDQESWFPGRTVAARRTARARTPGRR